MLPRDHYVRLAGNYYSVHPGAVGRRVHVSADLDRVQVHAGGQLVAEYNRCWPTIKPSPPPPMPPPQSSYERVAPDRGSRPSSRCKSEH